MGVAILAALSMVIQDIFEVLKDQAQARNHGFLAGLSDAVMWLMFYLSLGIAFKSKGFEHYLALVLITAANVIGQWTGVLIGKRYIKEAE